MAMLRSSAHSLKFVNKDKCRDIKTFLTEYRRLLQLLIDNIWSSGIPGYNFSIENNKLTCPAMLPNDYLQGYTSWFTARMKQCAGKQACSMIRAAVTKRRKQFYMLKKLQKEGKDTKYLQRKIDIRPLVKPNAKKANAELDSRFIDFQSGKQHFDSFVRVRTIGNNLMFNLPIKYTRVSKKWSKAGQQKQCVRLTDKTVTLIYEIHDKPKKPQGRLVGCDQGSLTVATLSDGQTTQADKHGHTLMSIQQKLARRKKNSHGFRRAQTHRKNYVNWSLNQLNWSNTNKVNLEKIKNIRYKKTSSRTMSHWSYTLIKEKLISLSETEGFELAETSNEFRSQRCARCGLVCKASRKGRTFICKGCGYTADADLNAATNHELDLPEIPHWVQQQKINRSGFYWLMSGLFTVDHEPIVRDTQKASA